ncbi:hypothetical protein HPB50_020467 [Hyalomma asiaticum]|uniref:Uncharacterized protein n=1 Tax=Hyalomma asiaticum TaxID=266040 RepID=A0ACB7RLB2_HYAAI|nr:hypothetical protein HPB50_020467 [Hyalomma asiaticum]
MHAGAQGQRHRQRHRQFIFSVNRFLWTLCGAKYPVCLNSGAIAGVCSRAPVQVMKVTRLRNQSQVRDWLRRNQDIAKSVKILHLVRDPRGILASRRRVDWCKESKSCTHPDTICTELRADLDCYEELKNALPNNAHRLRFEDLSVDPKREAVKLFNTLGMNYTHYTTMFLKAHTKARNADLRNPHSTRRNTRTVAFQWKTKLSYEDIVDIQRSCSDVLLRLGYKTINKNEISDRVSIVPVSHWTALTMLRMSAAMVTKRIY